MYTILMNDNKSLITTVRQPIYQRENLVDRIRFIFPQKYQELKLSECTATLKYINQGNIAHAEILQLSEELYSDRLQYFLPVDTKLTQFAGDITLRITFNKFDAETKRQYILHTGEVVIHVSSLPDYFNSVSNESLELIDKKISELDSKIEVIDRLADVYEKTKADNITKHPDNEIQLTANGVPIGDKISIIGSVDTPSDEDEFTVVEF